MFTFQLESLNFKNPYLILNFVEDLENCHDVLTSGRALPRIVMRTRALTTYLSGGLFTLQK